ncbi:unnamed protein product [Colias eurytheme]|nr:unnamed protein product [Colias eurytheme]
MSTENEIIINEVLCYISNRIDVIDEQAITQICTNSFSEKEIENAKAVICENLGTRITTRKGDSRSVKNVQDIIKTLKETEPDHLPIFVARDLHKIPPVTFDHLDVTKILKELTSLKTEVTQMKMNLITKSEITEMQNDMVSIKMKLCEQHKPTQQSDVVEDQHSDYGGRQEKIQKKVPSSHSTNIQTTATDVLCTKESVESRIVDTKVKASTHTSSYRDVVAAPRENNNRNDSDGFQLVTKRKKNTQRNMRGKGHADDLLQAVPTTSALYISRETWLMPHDLGFLSEIDEDFLYHGISGVNASEGILKGRPYGGVALLWRKNLFQQTNIIDTAEENSRVVAIKFKINNLFFIAMSVYMPCDCSDNLTEFTSTLSAMSAVVESCDVQMVYMLGDYNAHPDSLFGRELGAFCEEMDWRCSDIDMLDMQSTFTFISDVHGSVKWLDHCVCTISASRTIVKCEILYDVSWSDHLPLRLCCKFDMNIPPPKNHYE